MILKRICFFIITLFMVCLRITMSEFSSHATTFTDNYLLYTEKEDGTLSVSSYNRASHEEPFDLVIPTTVDGKKISSIDQSVFKGYTFSSISIGSGITIGNHAFENITVLPCNDTHISYSVFIYGNSDNPNHIGKYAFANAKLYCNIYFSYVDYIDDYAFYNTHFYDNSPSFPEVLHIGTSAFESSNLYMPTFSKNLSSLGDSAFKNTFLTSFTIYTDLISLGNNTFPSTTNIYIDSLVTNVQTIESGLFSLADHMLYIHESSTLEPYLAAHRFSYMVLETGFTYYPPALIGSIYNDPLTNCSYKITSNTTASLIKAQPASPYIDSPSAFNYYNYIYTVTHISSNAFSDASSLQTITLNDNLISISSNAFSSCSQLITLTLGKNIKTIEKNAFPNSKNLIICIPKEITSIDHYDIKNLTNVTFCLTSKSPLVQKLISMGLRVSILETPYTLPKGIIFNKNGAIYKVSGINEVTFIKPTNKKISKLTISSTLIFLGNPYNITTIASRACYKHSNLKKVVIGDCVRNIGDSAFEKCSSLRTISFGKNVYKLGKKVLYKDKKITSITIKSKRIKFIGKKSFSGIQKSVKIRVPRSKAKKYLRLIKKSL